MAHARTGFPQLRGVLEKKVMENRDCSTFYQDGKLLPWDELPTWFVQFLASSPPDEETEREAKEEMKRRGR
jgi:hypothetical protein